MLYKIGSTPVQNAKNLENIRIFSSEIRANIHELKEFGLNSFEVSSAGCKLMIVIVDS